MNLGKAFHMDVQYFAIFERSVKKYFQQLRNLVIVPPFIFTANAERFRAVRQRGVSRFWSRIHRQRVRDPNFYSF